MPGKSDVEGRAAKITVKTSVVRGSEQYGVPEKSRTIQIMPFEAEPAYVSVKNGFTKNMGNYESARVEVMVSFPCYPEDIVDTYKDVKKIVNGIMGDELKELLNGPEEE